MPIVTYAHHGITIAISLTPTISSRRRADLLALELDKVAVADRRVLAAVLGRRSSTAALLHLGFNMYALYLVRTR